MYEVTVKIGANPNKYWGSLEFSDAAGKVHRREVSGERDASKQSNTLQALIECLKVLKRPCMLSIYSSEDYIVSAFQCEWLTGWQSSGWKNAKGNTIRNVEQWKEVWNLLSPHSRRVMKEE